MISHGQRSKVTHIRLRVERLFVRRTSVFLLVDNVAEPLSKQIPQAAAAGAKARTSPRYSERILAFQSERGAFAVLFMKRAEVVAGGLSQRSSLLQFTPS